MGIDTRAVEVLQSLSLFSGLAPSEVSRIAAQAVCSSYRRGDAIVTHGRKAAGLHVVLSGQVTRTVRCGNGTGKILALLGAAQFFGEENVINDETAIAEVRCVTDAELLLLKNSSMRAAMQEFPCLSQNLMRHLSRRVRQLTAEVAAHALCTAQDRVIAYLLGLVPKHATGNVQHLVLDQKKSIIASQLNLTQEHFSRILRQLGNAELIQVYGHEITIIDTEKMRSSVCSLAAELSELAMPGCG